MPQPNYTRSAAAGGEDSRNGDGHERDSRDIRVKRDFLGYRGLLRETAQFLADYIVLPETSLLVLSAWVIAAWLADKWDRFPHVAINSPEKRCGKSLLLELLFLIVPRPRYTTNISPAALYRVVQAERPTLLMDESQSLSRRGSEASEVIREILNAGIGKNAKVIRCGGANHDQIEEFSVYSPKVFAMIGEPDGVLADRSLPVQMKRKTKDDQVQRYRSRVVEEDGKKLHAKLEKWAEDNAEKVAKVYDGLEPFAIANDRMADLLTPLQAVLEVLGGDPKVMEGRRPLTLLKEYAEGLDERDKAMEMQSPGVRLLAACRGIFSGEADRKTYVFLPTDLLIRWLAGRREEPWYRYNKGEPITREALANLLRPFGIKPSPNKKQTNRGYHAEDFREAWDRYLPPAAPLKNPPNPPNPYSPNGRKGVGQ
jgi:hypothetical protein